MNNFRNFVLLEDKDGILGSTISNMASSLSGNNGGQIRAIRMIPQNEKLQNISPEDIDQNSNQEASSQNPFATLPKHTLDVINNPEFLSDNSKMVKKCNTINIVQDLYDDVELDIDDQLEMAIADGMYGFVEKSSREVTSAETMRGRAIGGYFNRYPIEKDCMIYPTYNLGFRYGHYHEEPNGSIDLIDDGPVLAPTLVSGCAQVGPTALIVPLKNYNAILESFAFLVSYLSR